MTAREFAEAAEREWSLMPKPLLKEISGGLIVMASDKHMPGSRATVVLGEYQRDLAGRRVVLYYGSFLSILGDCDRQSWLAQIRKTIRHELRHHIEDLAGRADLAREDYLKNTKDGR